MKRIDISYDFFNFWLTVKQPENWDCTTDLNCPQEKVCFNHKCKNPCDIKNPCGKNAKCLTKEHRPKCECLPGFKGNPNIRCTNDNLSKTWHNSHINSLLVSLFLINILISRKLIYNSIKILFFDLYLWINSLLTVPKIPGNWECTTDLNCSPEEVCYNRKCKNPCDIANPCAANAKCTAKGHRPMCECLPGFQGDPSVLCSDDNISKTDLLITFPIYLLNLISI